MSSLTFFPDKSPPDIEEDDLWPLAIARAGMSYTQLGAICGVSADAVRKWDHRLSVPNWRAVRRFCWHLPHLAPLVVPVPEHNAEIVTLQLEGKKRA